MSILSRLFGTEKGIDNVLDKDNGLLVKFGGFVDRQQYTPEERAEADKETRMWAIKQLEAMAPFKVVQRILAFASALLWLIVGLNVLLAIWAEAFLTKQVTTIIDGATTVAKTEMILVEPMLKFAMSDYVFWPVITVYGLYFSGGVIESVKRKMGK